MIPVLIRVTDQWLDKFSPRLRESSWCEVRSRFSLTLMHQLHMKSLHSSHWTWTQHTSRSGGGFWLALWPEAISGSVLWQNESSSPPAERVIMRWLCVPLSLVTFQCLETKFEWNKIKFYYYSLFCCVSSSWRRSSCQMTEAAGESQQ